jgi:uncharacterized protein (DUF2147 family)
MHKFVRGLAAIALSATSATVAGAQEFKSPEGTWEIEMRDSRYSVAMCGDDGTQLCGTLIWLGNGADTPDNTPYLNTLLIDHASASGENRWQGDLHIYGQSASGKITQVSDDQITLEGCAFTVVCKTYQLYRID